MFFQFILADIVMGIAVYFSMKIINQNIFMQLFIPTLFGIVTYGLVLFIFKNQFFMELISIVNNLIKSRIKK